MAVLHEKVRNQRLDVTHKMITMLVNENQVIGVENLAVKNLMKNKKLARSIADAGWAEFLRCLEYKSDWYERKLIQIDRFFPSSKTCNHCKSVKESLFLKERIWTCEHCKTVHNRDVNAAQNIEEEALKKVS